MRNEVVIFNIGLLSANWLTGKVNCVPDMYGTRDGCKETNYNPDNVKGVHLLFILQSSYHMCSKCWHWCLRCMLKMLSRLRIWHCFRTCCCRLCGHEMVTYRHWSGCCRLISVVAFGRLRPTNWLAFSTTVFFKESKLQFFKFWDWLMILPPVLSIVCFHLILTLYVCK